MTPFGVCPLVAPGAGQPGRCRMCAAPLTGRRTRWCSETHAAWWANNHEWTSARREAIRRASILSTANGWDLWTYCDECGKRCLDISTAAGIRREAEVNHVEPRWGAGYDKGCWNHQTNLQVLCHSCHLAETARQRRERMFFDPTGEYRPVEGWSGTEVTAYIQHATRPAHWDTPKEPTDAVPLALWDAA